MKGCVILSNKESEDHFKRVTCPREKVIAFSSFRRRGTGKKHSHVIYSCPWPALRYALFLQYLAHPQYRNETWHAKLKCYELFFISSIVFGLMNRSILLAEFPHIMSNLKPPLIRHTNSMAHIHCTLGKGLNI